METKTIEISRAEYFAVSGCGLTAVTRAVEKKLGKKVIVVDYDRHTDESGWITVSVTVTYEERQPHRKVRLSVEGDKVVHHHD